MKYIVPIDSVAWNNRPEVLEKRGKDVIFICYNSSKTETMPIFGTVLACGSSAHPEIENNTGLLRGSLDFLDAHRKELLKMIGNDDVVVLSDFYSTSLSPYVLLQNASDYSGELHLIGVPPFDFMNRENMRIYHIIVRDLHRTRSAAFFDSDAFLEPRMTVPVCNWLPELCVALGEILKKLEVLTPLSKDKVYSYDSKTESYLEVPELRYPFFNIMENIPPYMEYRRTNGSGVSRG